MKKKYYILASLLFFFTGMTSCVGDLDVQPLDSTVVTAERAYSDAESYTKGLNKIYSVWAHSGQNGGDSDIQGSMAAKPYYCVAGGRCKNKLPTNVKMLPPERGSTKSMN